jgi:hypothetical protein
MLKEDFLPEDYDDELECRIQGCRQTEPFVLYHAKMEQLFKKLSTPVSDLKKLRRIKKNLHSFYKDKLVGKNIETIKDLRDICKEIEDLMPEDFWKIRKKEKVAIVETSSTHVTEESVSENPGPSPICQISSRNHNQPSNEFVCWNCDAQGHGFRRCRKSRKLFCFKCGKKNVTVKNCDVCLSKNQ